MWTEKAAQGCWGLRDLGFAQWPLGSLQGTGGTQGSVGQPPGLLDSYEECRDAGKKSANEQRNRYHFTSN